MTRLASFDLSMVGNLCRQVKLRSVALVLPGSHSVAVLGSSFVISIANTSNSPKMWLVTCLLPDRPRFDPGGRSGSSKRLIPNTWVILVWGSSGAQEKSAWHARVLKSIWCNPDGARGRIETTEKAPPKQGDARRRLIFGDLGRLDKTKRTEGFQRQRE